MAVKLKGLFVLFAGYLVKNCASLLDATNISKTGKRAVFLTVLVFWCVRNRYDNVASSRCSVSWGAARKMVKRKKIRERRFCAILLLTVVRAAP